MDKLVSKIDIEKEGFKQINIGVWQKGQEYYMKCHRCHKLLHTRNLNNITCPFCGVIMVRKNG